MPISRNALNGFFLTQRFTFCKRPPHAKKGLSTQIGTIDEQLQQARLKGREEQAFALLAQKDSGIVARISLTMAERLSS
jgi:hypothetical protein